MKVNKEIKQEEVVVKQILKKEVITIELDKNEAAFLGMVFGGLNQEKMRENVEKSIIFGEFECDVEELIKNNFNFNLYNDLCEVAGKKKY